jgi:hypothetical protein
MQPAGDLHQGVLGMDPGRPRESASDGLAVQEAQDLPPPVINAERAWASGESLVGQVSQQRVDRRRPQPGHPADSIPDAHRATCVAAIQALFLHACQSISAC